MYADDEIRNLCNSSDILNMNWVSLFSVT